MSRDFCRGCGAPLQSENSNKAGYVPEVLSGQRGQLICQRCYKMTHYGQAGTIVPSGKAIRQSIDKAIQASELLVVVADFTDVTGTLPLWADLLVGKPYVLMLNKCDLLPGRAQLTEIKEYLRQYLNSHRMAAPRDIVLGSAAKGQGVDILAKRLRLESSPGTKLALLGATNVGKSSMIKRLLANEGAVVHPTVSKFPGTTIGLSNWGLFKGRNTLIDTPGLAPGDRLSDLLCQRCNGQLFDTNKLSEKLWGLKPQQGLIFGGLVGLEPLENKADSVAIVFSANGLSSHRTNAARVKELLTGSPEWLQKLCEGCRNKLERQEVTIRIEPQQDLAIAGLGWISWRGAVVDYRMTLPKGLRWEIRPALLRKHE